MRPRFVSVFGAGALIAGLLAVSGASAASGSASFGPGTTGSVFVGSSVWAKPGATVALSISLQTAAKCVTVSGAHVADQNSASAKATWTFNNLSVIGSDGGRTVDVVGFVNQNCTGSKGGAGIEKINNAASYVVDGTAPSVTGAKTPNATWANSNVTVAWSATDGGSGVASGPTPGSHTVITEGATSRTATATDNVGNVGTGSISVQIDKTLPNISGSASPAPNAAGWNNTNVAIAFNCSDPANASNGSAASGIGTCAGSTTLNANGTATQLGTATDNANNVATASVGPIKIDKAAPNAPLVTVLPSANGLGWNNSPVTATFAANGDNPNNGSGVAACSAPSVQVGETSAAGITFSGTCGDIAGNTSATASSRLIKVDLTAPNTTANAPAGWNNDSVTVALGASDNLSGVQATRYTLNGGAATAGNSVQISAEGIHTLEVWSIDNAGNEEAHKSFTVKIDKTKPTISHTLSPAPNSLGWNNADVTVTFTCADSGAAASGIKTCTNPVTVTSNGKNQTVSGTAVDNANNTATDPANVDLDKAKPTISGAPDRAPDSGAWYNSPVTVNFTCADQTLLSGVTACTSPVSLTQGANQSVTGNVADTAGNSDSTTVGPINVDTTAPVVTGQATGTAGSNGWYTGDVTITWTCDDNLSGVVACPQPTVLTGEGSGLLGAVAVLDAAGNQGIGLVSGINIDRYAPTTTLNPPLPVYGNWYPGDVVLPFLAEDSLSGVANTFATVDGLAVATNAGVAGAPGIAVGGHGVHTVQYWSVDSAGNAEAKKSATVKIDANPPTIVGSKTPPNGAGWNNRPVDVTFVCADPDSGIASCSGDTTLTNEGANQNANGLATDNVGNTAMAEVSGINIDLTAPTVTGAAVEQPNAALWYRDDVHIRWTSADSLSGVAAQLADSTITGSGASLSAGPVTVTDNAGNVSAPATVTGIKIDRAAPVLTANAVNPDGSVRTPVSGWFNSSVTVRFSCSDALSGIAAACADDVVLDTDGAGQTASATASDVAGNPGSVTKTGINIDGQAPQTTAVESCTKRNGWCKGNQATVLLTTADQVGLSGPKEIRYRVNGGTWKTDFGSSTTVSVPLAAQSGLATVEFYGVDVAGNVEPQNGVSLKYDNLSPTVTHTVNPSANADDWNRANATVHFDAVDDIGGSGVDPATVTPDVTVSSETAGITVVGTAQDFAGNEGSDSALVKLDKTAPTISGAIVTAGPNAAGWFKTSVTVMWTCADALSGIALCPASDVVTTNGVGQSRTGNTADRASNPASASVSGINIDAVPPTVAITGLAGSPFIVGAANIGCTASDALSGLDGVCSVAITGGNGAVGSFHVVATATDKAGNIATAIGDYRVVYRFGGFLQPVNDTGRPQVCGTVCVASVFKGGSTIPVKFQLFNAAGQLVASPALPQWVNPKQGSATTLGIDEVVYTDPSTSGQSYRWDASSQQYIYNWGTKGVRIGYFWKIGVILDDGNTYLVDVALR